MASGRSNGRYPLLRVLEQQALACSWRTTKLSGYDGHY